MGAVLDYFQERSEKQLAAHALSHHIETSAQDAYRALPREEAEKLHAIVEELSVKLNLDEQDAFRLVVSLGMFLALESPLPVGIPVDNSQSVSKAFSAVEVYSNVY